MKQIRDRAYAANMHVCKLTISMRARTRTDRPAAATILVQTYTHDDMQQEAKLDMQQLLERNMCVPHAAMSHQRRLSKAVIAALHKWRRPMLDRNSKVPCLGCKYTLSTRRLEFSKEVGEVKKVGIL